MSWILEEQLSNVLDLAKSIQGLGILTDSPWKVC